MKKDLYEALVGALVIFVGVMFFFAVSTSTSKVDNKDMYFIKAKFNRTDGISVGSMVRVAGIPVGTVYAQKLDENYRTIVTLQIENRIKLPEDTAAIVNTDGLFGAKYIELETGGMEEIIKPEGFVAYTQGSMVVEELLAKLIAIAKSKRNSKKIEMLDDGGIITGPKLGMNTKENSLIGVYNG